VPNVHTTYWARWVPRNNVIVTFNPNEGNVSPTTRTVQAGQTVGTLPIPTREGSRFVGWFTARIAGTQVSASTVVERDVTYWARWSTVTLNVSRVSWDTSSQAASITVNVTSDATWAATSNNAGWLTISNFTPVNQTGNGSFRINVTAFY